MGRLWDDHFRQLGHPPKFCRVQDASSGNHSPFWYHFRFILMKKSLNKSLNIMFFPKNDFRNKEKTLPGCLQTVVRSGDAPKPPFPIETNKKSKKSGNQPQISHRKYPLFLSLIFGAILRDGAQFCR